MPLRVVIKFWFIANIDQSLEAGRTSRQNCNNSAGEPRERPTQCSIGRMRSACSFSFSRCNLLEPTCCCRWPVRPTNRQTEWLLWLWLWWSLSIISTSPVIASGRCCPLPAPLQLLLRKIVDEPLERSGNHLLVQYREAWFESQPFRYSNLNDSRGASVSFD